MAGLTSTGFDILTQDEIETTIKDYVRGTISPTLDTGSGSLPGELASVTAREARSVWELAQAIYAARDIRQATGEDLTTLCALVGVIRRAATYSEDYLDLDLDAGTYAAGDLVVHVVGDPTIRFENAAEVVVAVGGVQPAIRMVSQMAGVVRANAGTLTVIADPIAGFNAVDDDPEDATLGADEESDAALRARHKAQLAAFGSHTVDAIRAAVLEVSGVTGCRVTENVTNVTDANGLPPHSVAVYVDGGLDAAIAAAIFNKVPAGIKAYGSTEEVVTDAQGIDHTIGFTRPADVNVYVTVTLTALTGLYIGDAALKQLLVDWGDALGNGRDVSYAQALAVAATAAGVVDVTDFRLGVSASPTGQITLVMDPDERADFDTTRITVTSTLVSGAP